MAIRKLWLGMLLASLLVMGPVSTYSAEKRLANSPSAAPPVAAPPTDRFDRPIPMGVSISNTPSLPYIYAGTAGMLVRSLTNPDVKFILSNNHVLGAVGPDLCPNTAPQGTWTLQPGTLDIGNDPGKDPFYVAGVVAGYYPLIGGILPRNIIDAAISITNTSLAKTQILNIGNPNPAVGIASPGMNVIKSGRTTGVTNGTVDSVNVSVGVDYDCAVYYFRGQTMITPGTFSAGGDSGSAILESGTLTPVGLLYAGSPEFTVANQIFWVYALLKVFPDAPTPVGPTSMEELQQIYDAKLKMQHPRLAKLQEIQERNEEALFRNFPAMRAMGIGRHENGRDLVFKIYRKRGAGAAQQALPQSIEGVEVRVVDTQGDFKAR